MITLPSTIINTQKGSFLLMTVPVPLKEKWQKKSYWMQKGKKCSILVLTLDQRLGIKLNWPMPNINSTEKLYYAEHQFSWEFLLNQQLMPIIHISNTII